MAKRRKKSIAGGNKPKKSPSRKKSGISGKTIFFILILLGGFSYGYYKIFVETKPDNREELIASIPEGFPSFGIDISHHQGEIDWKDLLKTQGYDSIIQFVYCKATEGSDHVDSRWEENRESLQALQMPHGAYHFFSPKTPPRPQVTHFLNHWEKSSLDLPPVLDVEAEGFSDKDLIAKMKIWLTEVERLTGIRPIIYTSLHFFETKFRNDFKNYQFWIAAYSRKPDCIEDSRLIHWQYSEKGELPGIDENVDLNVSKLIFK